MTKEEKAGIMLEMIKNSRLPLLFKKVERTDQGMFFILAYLEKNKDKEIIAGQFAEESGISTARVAVLLKKMEKKDWIRKYSSKKDARKTVVILTEKGKNVIDNVKASLLKKMISLMDDVGEEEIQTFITISQKMVASLTKHGFMPEIADETE